MNYKDVLDDLTDLLDRHKMIQTWGYGNLSDLVSPFRRTAKTQGNVNTEPESNDIYNIDYPYAFLQPTNHNLSRGKTTFNFNLIMMEMCDDAPEAVIQAQSNCYSYIKDVLAEIYYNFDQKYDFTLNSSVTPFKEKYNDTVSGMTAAISIEIPTVLDDCVAPFRPKYTTDYIWVAREAIQFVGSDVGEDKVIQAQTYYLNPGDQWDVNRLVVDEDMTLKVEVTGYIRTIPGSGEEIPRPFYIRRDNDPVDQFESANTIEGWPESNDGEWRTFVATWDYVTFEATSVYNFITLFDEPGQETNFELKDIQIKFYAV